MELAFFLIHIFSIFTIISSVIVLLLLYKEYKNRGFITFSLFIVLHGIGYGIGLFVSIPLIKDPLNREIELLISTTPWIFLDLFKISGAILGRITVDLLLFKKFNKIKYLLLSLTGLLFILFFVFTKNSNLQRVPYILINLFYYLNLYLILLGINKNKAQLHSNIKRKVIILTTLYMFLFFPLMFIDDILITFNLSLLYNASKAVGFTLLTLSIIYLSITQLLKLINSKEKSAEILYKEAGLTNREEDVFKELINNKTYKEIAIKLNISADTVKTHASKIYKKTGVKSKQELKHIYKKY